MTIKNVDSLDFIGNKASDDRCKLLLFRVPTHSHCIMYVAFRQFGRGISILIEGWKFSRYDALCDATSRLESWGFKPSNEVIDLIEKGEEGEDVG